MGPKRRVSGPRLAITSTGRQPSKKNSFSKSWTLGALGGRERLVEAPVLGLGQRAVDVVVAALAVARGPEGLRDVDGVGLHHRAHGVVEVEVGGAHEGGDVAGQGVRGEGPVATMVDRVVGDARTSSRWRRTPGRAVDGLGDAPGEEARGPRRARCPPGTFTSSATRTTSESIRRISSLRRPAAWSRALPRRLFEQTSSAKSPVWCTGVAGTGRIS